MNERQKELVEWLKHKKALTLEEIAKHLAYSTSTIRRDIGVLQDIGLLKLEKGIVKLTLSSSKEKHFKLRNLENSSEKEEIAKLCEDFFRDGMSIFLDGSSTILKVCPILAKYKNITVVTNGVEVAHELMQYAHVEVFMTGGYIRSGTSSIVGEPAMAFIKQFNLDLTILSCSGIDEDAIYDASLQQAYVKKCMLEQAHIRLLLCDSSKFNQVYKFTLGTLRDVDYLLTNALPSVRLEEQARRFECEILMP